MKNITIIELPFLFTFIDMQFKVRTRFDKKNEITGLRSLTNLTST